MKNLYLIFSLLLLNFVSFVSVFAQSETTLSLPRINENSKKDQDAEKAKKYEAQFQFSTESLTKNFGTWRTASIYIQRKFDDKRIIWANYRFSDRNSNHDQEFVAGIYQPLKNKWAFTSEAMYSPSHKYVGKFSVMGELEKGFKKGFVGHAGTRFTKYDAVNATTGYGILEKYWGNNRAAYTLYLTKLSNAGTAPTHRFQYNRYYGEESGSIGAAFSFGREHENLGPTVGILRSKTWSVNFSVRHWLAKNFGLSIDGTIHRQGDLYYRRGLTFGLRYRF